MHNKQVKKLSLFAIFSLSVVTLLLFTVLLKLGFWQLGRYHAKLELQKKLEDNYAYTLFDTNTKDIESVLYEPFILKGKFSNKTILLDNQTIKGKFGYLIYSLFRVEGKNKYVLVNRGFIQAPNLNRSQLPVIEIPDKKGLLTLKGRFVKTHVNKMSTNDIESFANILRVQQVHINSIKDKLNSNFKNKIDIEGYVFKLDKDTSHTYFVQNSSNWLTPKKHLGYAVQWFAMAAMFMFLVIFYTIRYKGKNANEK